MSKFNHITLTKKLTRYVQIFFILSCLINLINCASEEDEKARAELIAGMGKGTLAVVIAIAIGVVICIFGLAFSSPGLFVFIGVIIPVLVFIICISLPNDKSDEEVDINKNTHFDYYMVARWIHFIIMLILFIGLFFPAFLKWNTTVIPQRVNSNTMKDTYDDKYLEDLEKQKKMKYNLENDSIVDDEERLPLSSNKKKRNVFIRLDKENENNVNNNLLDNNLVDENTLPIATVKRKDELNENRGKFKKFKRIQNTSQ